LKATRQPAERPARAAPAWWGRILVESVLIVFSILLALFVDQRREERRLDELRDRALHAIHSEIALNLRAVESVVDYHGTVRDRLGALLNRIEAGEVENASAWNLALSVAPQGIGRAGVASTAWQTAATSGAVSLLDISLTYRLGGLYDIQSKGVEASLERIQELLFDPIMHDPSRSMAVLRVLMNLANELTQQEVYLTQQYSEILADPAFTEIASEPREAEPDSSESDGGESR
jgi:hypothetical protein